MEISSTQRIFIEYQHTEQKRNWDVHGCIEDARRQVKTFTGYKNSILWDITQCIRCKATDVS
jgi:hypothetical protein